MKKTRYAGFTLVEMMVVILIISVLLLLFIPNLSSQRENVTRQGNEALVQSIRTQIELAEFEKERTLTDAEIKELLKNDQKKIDLYFQSVDK
ncbi:competence type IV pilus major pilin ComGC [Enterococcus sp. LJL98]